MITTDKSFLIRCMTLSKTRPVIVAMATAILLAGCSSDDGGMSGFGISNMKWFNSSEPPTAESFKVGSSPLNPGSGHGQEIIIQNTIELSDQKRFLEARILLGELRDIQHRESDGYRALSTSMALLALREGDIDAFKRISRQLDISLGTPVRVPPAYAEVISLYRAMNQQSLPVNASEKIQQLRDRLLPVETAGINKGVQ
jgi:hypothetical protein